MTDLFLDPDHARRFERDGYFVVDLLDPADVARLRAQHAEVAGGDANNEGFVASLAGRPLAQNQAIAEQINAVVVPRLATVLKGCTVIGSTFLAKGSGPDGEMVVHQDWCSVDERRARSLNVWCALDDVAPDGGALEVIAGSHRWFDAVRSPTIPSVQVEFGPSIDHALTVLSLSAGQAVVYDHALLHGSRQNRSGSVRLAAQLGLLPEGEPLVMGFVSDEGEVELRWVEPTAFFLGFEYETAARVDAPGTPVERLPASAAKLDERSVLDRVVSEIGPPPGADRPAPVPPSSRRAAAVETAVARARDALRAVRRDKPDA